MFWKTNWNFKKSHIEVQWFLIYLKLFILLNFWAKPAIKKDMFLFILKENQKERFTQNNVWNIWVYFLFQSPFSFPFFCINCLNVSFHFILNLLVCPDFRFSLAALSQLAKGIKLRPLLSSSKDFLCFLIASASSLVFISSMGETKSI